jgi:nucleoside-diphosphate-sugar epimerase
MIYGAGAVNWTGKLFRVAKLNPTPFLGNGNGSVFPIHVDDVVDLLVTTASHPAATNQIFNCTPDPSPTWREFLGHYSRLAGHDKWLSLPPALFSAVASIVGVVAPPRSKLRDFSEQVDFLQHKITYRMAKARHLLGWSPHVALDAGVASCAPWLREKGWLR